jgi:hypothetical protein
MHKRIISAVTRVDFVSDRMSYVIPTGCWCHITVLKFHAQTEDKAANVKDSFYEKSKRVCLKFMLIMFFRLPLVLPIHFLLSGFN